MKRYDPHKLEKKWQSSWKRTKLYRAADVSKKPKYYCLVEFPYPSGEGLHVGHVRSYTAIDAVARKRRMQGFDVLYPIGWDAFGLPTEQYAIKTGIQPKVVTKRNTGYFRRQLQALGFSFDWEREVDTSDPAYFRWTQWIFLQMFKKGLAYKAKIPINWCPNDKIGLANEEVIDGKCERCGTPVEKRDKEQWMLAITKYADRLDKDLDTVDYPERVKIQQRNWIGKSEGALLTFKLVAPDFKGAIEVFTTRPDTLFGVTYVVLSPEHPLVAKLLPLSTNQKEVERYVASAKQKTEDERAAPEKDKSGVELKGIRAVNPANGEKVPVWVADYVLAGYGTGAVMAVPAHDERDFAFAKKYNLPVRYVVAPHIHAADDPEKPDKPVVPRKAVQCYVKDPRNGNYLFLKWKVTGWRGPVSGGVEKDEDPIEAGKREIREETGYKNVRFIETLGCPLRVDFYHPHKDENRHALFTGLSFELINDEKDPVADEEIKKHEAVWLSPEEAKVFLNTGTAFFERLKTGISAYTGEGVLIDSGPYTDKPNVEAGREITNKFGIPRVTYKLRDWVFSRQRYWGEPIPLVHCEEDGWVPVPEKELPVKLPNVKNYQPTDTGESPLAAISKWVNTKCPKCGGPARRETDTMPNWAGSSWYYLRYIDPKNGKAFADKKKLTRWLPVDWYNGGMEHTTLHLLYSRFWHKFLFDEKLVPTAEPYAKRTSHGLILAEGGMKMSKSKPETVINPQAIIERFGADSLRLYELFIGPFEQAVSWSMDGVVGTRRFLERVYALGEKTEKGVKTDVATLRVLHQTIQKVTGDIEALKFNTAVSQLMILVNRFDKLESLPHDVWLVFLRLLAPFAPHIADELWHEAGGNGSVHASPWPEFDPALTREETVTIGVQVNGKLRGSIAVSPDTAEAEAVTLALALPEIKKWVGDIQPKKIVYVRGKVLSLVV